jgi:predicted site-specific integrase-resolvase
MVNLSTKQIARKVGISRATLERWLATGVVPMPNTIQFGGSKFRNWTTADIKRISRYKEENYCKGRGRKPKRSAQ